MRDPGRTTLASLAPVLAPQDGSAIAGDAEIQRAHDELLAALFCELTRRGGAADASASLSPGKRWRVVRRAEEYLDGQGDVSVLIDDLCVAACTSLSRLERSFHEVFGIGPRAS